MEEIRMTQLVVKCNHNQVSKPKKSEVIKWDFIEPQYENRSRHTGELEQGRKSLVRWFGEMILPTAIVTRLGMRATHAFAATQNANDLRRGFMDIVDIFTAIAEPILWFYALIGFIMMATGKSKDAGWNRIKNVGYAYIGISMLPTMFQMLRWISNIIRSSISF